MSEVVTYYGVRKQGYGWEYSGTRETEELEHTPPAPNMRVHPFAHEYARYNPRQKLYVQIVGNRGLAWVYDPTHPTGRPWIRREEWDIEDLRHPTVRGFKPEYMERIKPLWTL